MDNSLPQKSERQYKDTLFRTLFSDDKNFLELYNAIVAAIDLCISTNILSEFLTKHYQGVLKMLSWEYDADTERRVLREEALEEGLQQGRQQGKQEGLQEAKQNVAKELKKSVIMTSEEIAKITGLSVQEIDSL